MWFPKKYHYNPKTFITMKVDLNVSAASKVMTANGCSKMYENFCGIMYRAS